MSSSSDVCKLANLDFPHPPPRCCSIYCSGPEVEKIFGSFSETWVNVVQRKGFCNLFFDRTCWELHNNDAGNTGETNC